MDLRCFAAIMLACFVPARSGVTWGVALWFAGSSMPPPDWLTSHLLLGIVIPLLGLRSD